MNDIKPELIEQAASAAWNGEGVIRPGKNDWNSIGETFREPERQYIAVALSAVADDLRAEGAAKALREAAGSPIPRGALTRETRAWLRARADRIEARDE